jgi:cobalt transporter subunit CbtA
VLANVVLGVGFALLLVAAFALSGRAVDARYGALWGAAGFAVFVLGPGLGLPPEVPGMAAAGDLLARQLWWLLAVGCTAAGLGLLAFGRGPALALLGALALVLPHAIGAPHPAEVGAGGVVPPELAGRFVAASFVTAAAFWALLGASAGALYRRLV